MQKINLMPQRIKNEIKDYKIYYAVIFSFLLVLAVVLIYFAFNMYENSLTAAKNDVEKDIVGVNTVIEQNSSADINAFQKRLKYLSQELDAHVYWSGVFNFLEAHALKKIRYDSFQGIIADDGGSVDLTFDAFAPNFIEAAEQVMAFRQSGDAKSVSAYSFKVNKDGEVYFTIFLSLKKNLLYERE